MYQLIFGSHFLKSAVKLDKNIQSMLKASLDIFMENPFSSGLKTKPLTGKLSGYYSFRFAKNYRVIFRFVSNGNIHLVKVSHRKDIYR